MYATLAAYRGRLSGGVFEQIYGFDEADALADLEGAAAEIDGRVAVRYAVPVTSAAVLPLLADWNLTLAEERGYARCAGSQFAEKVTARVEQVRKYLELVAGGGFFLSGAASNADSAAAGASRIRGNAPVCTREDLAGY